MGRHEDAYAVLPAGRERRPARRRVPAL